MQEGESCEQGEGKAGTGQQGMEREQEQSHLEQPDHSVPPYPNRAFILKNEKANEQISINKYRKGQMITRTKQNPYQRTRKDYCFFIYSYWGMILYLKSDIPNFREHSLDRSVVTY